MDPRDASGTYPNIAAIPCQAKGKGPSGLSPCDLRLQLQLFYQSATGCVCCAAQKGFQTHVDC